MVALFTGMNHVIDFDTGSYICCEYFMADIIKSTSLDLHSALPEVSLPQLALKAVLLKLHPVLPLLLWEAPSALRANAAHRALHVMSVSHVPAGLAVVS